MATAVITGAGQGLGRATANRLHRDGWDIIAVDMNPETVKRTAEETGGLAIVCNVADQADVVAMGKEVASHGNIGALVNNAGIWRYSGVLGISPEDAHDVVETNFLGTLWCTQEIVPAMVENGGGSIVNFSSVASLMSAHMVGIYPATKSAIETLTRMCALEFGPQGIRANTIAPGMMVTESTQANYEGEMGAIRAKMIPLQRVGSPEDIANVVSFLCSKDASYVSGQLIAVDGAMSAGQVGTAPIASGPGKIS